MLFLIVETESTIRQQDFYHKKTASEEAVSFQLRNFTLIAANNAQ